MYMWLAQLSCDVGVKDMVEWGKWRIFPFRAPKVCYTRLSCSSEGRGMTLMIAYDGILILKMTCETAAWTTSQSDLVSAAGSRAAQVSRLHNSPKHADVSEWGILTPYMFYFAHFLYRFQKTIMPLQKLLTVPLAVMEQRIAVISPGLLKNQSNVNHKA